MAVTHEEVEQFALSFPEAYLDHPWGESVVKVGKRIFVFVGQSPEGVTVTVKVPQDVLELWEHRADTFRPAYVGRYGWIGLYVRSSDAWQTAQEGIALSYQIIAPKRLSGAVRPHRT